MNSIKLFYISNNQLPTIKAHGIQIVKTCEALVALGIPCELIIPDRRLYPEVTERDPLAYYGVRTPFTVTRLPSASFIQVPFRSIIGKPLFWLQQLLFARTIRRYLGDKPSVVYSRDPFTLFVLRNAPHRLIWEAHTFPRSATSFFYKRVLGRINGLVVISDGLRKVFAEHFKGPIVVAPDGVDVNDFALDISKQQARAQLDLPENQRIVLYSGHSYPWKGTDTLIQAARLLPQNILVVFVGGTLSDIAEYRAKASGMKNVLFAGYQPHGRIPLYLKAADVLVLPNSARDAISRLYTSPLKMFEYMAAGTPIVASDLPSIREVLNERNAVLVHPDDSRACAEGIRTVLSDSSRAAQLATQAEHDVRRYTWSARARIIKRLL